MKAVLHGTSGPGADIRIVVGEGTPSSVGRSPACTICISNDRFISGKHFEVVVSSGQLYLRDLGSTNGTFVNGARVQEFLLQNRDAVLAGETIFTVELSAGDVPGVLELLASQPYPLYAVLDAARNPAIYPLLLASGAYHWSLYTGQSALKLETLAPYLVYLPPQSELLPKLLAQGWGDSWGIFLSSPQQPDAIWHEMRRFLMVTLETTQKMVYFRFYDPRVLRMFLPIADDGQLAQFAKVASAFLTEGEDPDVLLRFQPLPSGCYTEQFLVQNEGGSE